MLSMRRARRALSASVATLLGVGLPLLTNDAHCQEPDPQLGQVAIAADPIAAAGIESLPVVGSDLSVESAAVDPGLWEEGHGAGCGCAGCQSRITGEYPTLAMERVPLALFEIDTATPMNVFRIGLDFAYDLEFPDRAEIFWAKIGGKGPNVQRGGVDSGERNVDYQDLKFYMERGNDTAAAFTELVIRTLDPTDFDNHAGLADMNVGVKTVLLSGDDYKLTTIFRTYIPTGSDSKGLGVGHAKMEPGVLGNYKLSDYSYVHGEITYLFHISGDSEFSGEVLKYGVGLSHVLYERTCDNFAVIPTLELVGWTVLDGRQTLPGLAVMGKRQSEGIDSIGIFNVQPGVRILHGEKFEFGVSASFAVTDDHWYDELLRVECRWHF